VFAVMKRLPEIQRLVRRLSGEVETEKSAGK
jgi:hypothetical protein